MLLSLGIIILGGMLSAQLFEKLKLPGLIGFLLTGIILGPGLLGLIDENLLAISPDLRTIALIIILTRAGLSLNIDDLKKVGRPALFMSFLPACLEIIGMVLIAPLLFDITVKEALILGTVVAAVSPAVIVPKMIKIIQEGYGVKKSIPQMILAAATVDDIFVIVLFSIFVNIGDNTVSAMTELFTLPLSIVLGCLLGILIGYILFKVFKRFHIRDSKKVLIILAIGLLLYPLEELSAYIPFSALIATISMGILLKNKNPYLSERLSNKFSRLWIFAELILFVLVGATVDPIYLTKSFPIVLLLLILVILFRIAGVLLSLIKTNINKKERIFCAIGYLPKATVQAAIGSVPLSMGLACGEIVLTVSVAAILITAPLGAWLIEFCYKKLLK